MKNKKPFPSFRCLRIHTYSLNKKNTDLQVIDCQKWFDMPQPKNMLIKAILIDV